MTRLIDKGSKSSRHGYILSIDQSTSCTKALLFDGAGNLTCRFDLPHRQIINERGWVEHDTDEIWKNLIGAVKGVLEKSGVVKGEIAGAALSNQRETSIVWDKSTGLPLYNAIVWQCGRAEEICRRIASNGAEDLIKRATGINLSPYYSAGKIAWVLENVDKARQAANKGVLCCSTIDSWLIYMLTDGEAVKTDYSNASRSQLLNIHKLEWDKDVCSLFGIDVAYLPELADSDDLFGYTDFGGVLDRKVPLHGVMGDSHGALYAQGCHEKGTVKATYGTGSSVMMNTGGTPAESKDIVTSLAWRLNGKVNYVLEGNINYTGAVIKWLVENLGIMSSSKEAESLARKAKHVPGLYFVPAFSGLGAPYWDGNARAMISGMDRGCGKAEIVKAAEDCIVYQITDIIRLMEREIKEPIKTLRVDGGPTRDAYLMQFQADMADTEVRVPEFEELSGMGPAYVAGIALGIYNAGDIFEKTPAASYVPSIAKEQREKLYSGWREAVGRVLVNSFSGVVSA
jgi:glycerol kinase